MIYTVISLTLVGVILLFWLYKLMCRCFCRSFCIWKNQKDGTITTKEATILSVNTIKKGEKPLLELLLLFENFSGHPIHRKIRVWDSKPHLKRFCPDDKIPIGLNNAKKPKDPVFLALGECRVSFIFVLLCCLKIIAYVSGCYFFMGEAIQRIFSNPEKYEHLFMESEMWQMGLLFTSTVVFLLFLLNQIGFLIEGKTKTQNWDLLYHGIGAKAKIKEQKDTKTFIDNRPVVQFVYTFKDHGGLLVKGVDKKAIEKPEVSAYAEMDGLEIMYLPSNPRVSALTENVENQGPFKYIDFLFLFVMIVFSVVLITSFYRVVF